MSVIAVIEVIEVIEEVATVVTSIVGKGTAAAAVEYISAAVISAVGAAFICAFTTVIAAGISSSVSGTITTISTEAVENAIQKNLDKAVKDVISSQGISDISKAMTVLPTEVVVNRLAESAIDAINPHLWVFTDPTFFRLTRLIRVLRAIKEGEKPEDTDDDDCDEEKCRFFEGPPVADDSEDFIFFTVFGSGECEEGDEVYSMSAQWKKLKSLVDDPIGGHFVSQIFQELFESCTEDVDEEETVSSTFVGIVKPAPTAKKTNVKVAYGRLVYFGYETIYNIYGSAQDRRSPNWLKTYFALGYGECGKCYIGSEEPECGHTDPLEGNIVGGHVWSPALKEADESMYYYILPICKRHNKRFTYDKPKSDGTGWMKTTPDAYAMRITSTDKVVGWKGKLSHLIGSKTSMLKAAVKLENDGGAGEAGEYHEIIQPKQLMNWLLEEVHKIALEFTKDPIETVFKELSATVLGKLREIIKSAGTDAIDWAKSEGKNIELQSLIPLYGTYQAIKRLSSLKSDAIGRFHNGTRSALFRYKEECLGDAEQERRKTRLVEETDKVISSKKWKDRLVAFEGTVASKLPTMLKP